MTPIKFSFDLPQNGTPESSPSPRSNVAHRFRGLALGGGGGAIGDDGDDEQDGSADPTRKRQKADDVMSDAVDGSTEQRCNKSPVSESPLKAAISTERKEVTILDTVDASTTEASISEQTSSPRRKRAGTPPLRLKKTPSRASKAASDGDDDEPDVADPVRAALTWHEDEITIYDPNDEDDDGTGINGVGFRPTPALAQARASKRRQQISEYRKREESEARAKRSQRRRGEVPLSARPQKKSPTRRVRFKESERLGVAITTRI